MKKILALLLVAVMCLSFVACGGGSNKLVRKNSDGSYDLNLSTFGSAIEKGVDLTLENWSNYLQIKSYNAEVDVVENGEIVRKTETRSAIIASLDRFHLIDNFVIELKHKERGEIRKIDIGYSNKNEFGIIDAEEGFSFDDYDCLNIQGTIYYYNLPEEVIPTNKSGNVTINFTDNNGIAFVVMLEVNLDLKYVIDRDPNTWQSLMK